MSFRFSLAMAWRESRFSRRRLTFSATAIALGVAALVAINSFRVGVTAGIRAQARALLGADLELSSRQRFALPIESLLDSLARADVPTARVTSFPSMAFIPRTGLTRLVETRAVQGGYPFYGVIETRPPGRWAALRSGQRPDALVDEAVLIQLAARVGDTLALGEGRFVITGVLVNVPGEIGLRTAFGPRVYIPAAYLEETGLLRLGSLARYRAYVQLPDEGGRLQPFINRHVPLFRAHRVGFDTVAEREEDLTEAFSFLARFLGLVGLVALLLGGIGVASAVHVFIRAKLETVAVLRCLGATAATVFSVYLLQTGLLGLAGAAAGAVLGVAVQALLPGLLRDFLPLEIAPTVSWGTVGSGLAIGLWVSLAFALLPLTAIRRVTPLQAIRRDFTPPDRGPDRLRAGVWVALAVSVVLLSVSQAPAPAVGTGLAFAATLGCSLGALWLAAWGATRALRRWFPKRASYVVRQGVANLFRPQNQTIAVTLAVGLGVFLLATLAVVQRNLHDQLSLDVRPDRPNLVAFDIQQDQRNGVLALVQRHRLPLLGLTPIVPGRIAAVNGRAVGPAAGDSVAPPGSRWARRREYRNTYRDTLVTSEQIVAGTWWGKGGGRGRGKGDPWRVSVEEGLAEELGVGVGDRIIWDVQGGGSRVETRIASLRRVQWARFEPNFFVVFEPGALESAPQSFVLLTRAADARRRAAWQRDLVAGYSNVATLDLSLVQATLDAIVGKIVLAIRFMALFCLASGAIVLVGAILTSRFQRQRESVLLRTIGATARQIGRIQLTEYVALGSLAGLMGIALGGAGGWALIVFLFDFSFRLPAAPLAGLWLSTIALTTITGALLSRDVLRRAPIAGLQEVDR